MTVAVGGATHSLVTAAVEGVRDNRAFSYKHLGEAYKPGCYVKISRQVLELDTLDCEIVNYVSIR